MIEPTPMLIKATRVAAGLTQSQAAELLHLGAYQRWAEYERGTRVISSASWELFLVKTGNHELYKPVPGVPVPTRENGVDAARQPDYPSPGNGLPREHRPEDFRPAYKGGGRMKNRP